MRSADEAIAVGSPLGDALGIGALASELAHGGGRRTENTALASERPTANLMEGLHWSAASGASLGNVASRSYTARKRGASSNACKA